MDNFVTLDARRAAIGNLKWVDIAKELRKCGYSGMSPARVSKIVHGYEVGKAAEEILYRIENIITEKEQERGLQ